MDLATQEEEKQFLGRVLYKLTNPNKNFDELEENNKNIFIAIAIKFSSILLKRMEYKQLQKDMEILNDFIKK